MLISTIRITALTTRNYIEKSAAFIGLHYVRVFHMDFYCDSCVWYGYIHTFNTYL